MFLHVLFALIAIVLLKLLASFVNAEQSDRLSRGLETSCRCFTSK